MPGQTKDQAAEIRCACARGELTVPLTTTRMQRIGYRKPVDVTWR